MARPGSIPIAFTGRSSPDVKKATHLYCDDTVAFLTEQKNGF
jgi:hypothetical protein